MNYYKILEVLFIVLIVLNILDSFTTLVGVSSFGVEEGNPLIASFVHNVSLFLWIKVGFISLFFLAGLGYLLKIHHAFPKLWENEIAITTAVLVVLFYAGVVINNIFVLI